MSAQQETAMATVIAPATPASAWTRFWRRLIQIEEDLSLGHDGWQDRRIAFLESELRALKQQMADLQQERDGPD